MKQASDGANHDRSAAESRPVVRYQGGAADRRNDRLAVEEPLEIHLAGLALAVIMRTPGDDESLIRGFGLTEGIVLDPSEIAGVDRLDDAGNRRELRLAEGVKVDPERFRRNLFASSSCGVCGKASIDALRVAASVAALGPTIDRTVLVSLPERLGHAQPTFAETGGLHAAAAFEPDGTLLDASEDVGRHNAVDKLIGRLSTNGWPLEDMVMMVSGRTSFEVIQKAAVAGISFVAAVSAPSTLAVDLADEMGMTLVGFLRDGRFNIYTGQERVAGGGWHEAIAGT